MNKNSKRREALLYHAKPTPGKYKWFLPKYESVPFIGVYSGVKVLFGNSKDV
jgi:hypothetical protein